MTHPVPPSSSLMPQSVSFPKLGVLVSTGSHSLLVLSHSFITRKNRQVCANPDKKWVREYINSLEMN